MQQRPNVINTYIYMPISSLHLPFKIYSLNLIQQIKATKRIIIIIIIIKKKKKNKGTWQQLSCVNVLAPNPLRLKWCLGHSLKLIKKDLW